MKILPNHKVVVHAGTETLIYAPHGRATGTIYQDGKIDSNPWKRHVTKRDLEFTQIEVVKDTWGRVAKRSGFLPVWRTNNNGDICYMLVPQDSITVDKVQ